MTHTVADRARSSTRTKAPIGLWQVLAIGVAGGAVAYVSISYLLQAAVWTVPDANAYWDAAIRLREGQPLYQAGAGVEDATLYRYAPWFAFVWVPLTLLPKAAVFAAWSALLLVSALLAVAPILKIRTPTSMLGAFLLGTFLIWTASRGNVQPLIILALLATVERRSGPFWVAVAASIKLVPIAYAVVWAGRGEWRKVAVTLAVTVLLVAPAALFNIGDYTTSAGARPPLLQLLPIQVVGVALAAAATWFVSRTRYAWIAASVLAMLALPRFVEYNVTFALVGTAEARPRTNGLR